MLLRGDIFRRQVGAEGRCGQPPPHRYPHAILIAFCAAIFLPLLWLARVALTDKATAYKLPPEWVALRLDNFAEIFRQFDFGHAFLNSIIAAVGSTAISLPLATCMPRAHRKVGQRRRGARVVDRGGLENRCTCKGTEGSNPSLSASAS